eukprot:s1240_g5.t1
MARESIEVTVSLASGRSEKFSLPESSKVGDLRDEVQKSFRLGFLKLLNASQILRSGTSLADAGIKAGDHLTAISLEIRLVATQEAFALFTRGGTVLTWGDVDYGADCSAVQDCLKEVVNITASDHSFAALLANGAVVTWGQPREIKSADSAFAAIRSDGRVVTWGDPNNGGDSTAVQDQLVLVHEIQSCDDAFAAIVGVDRRVVTWGAASPGIDISKVQDRLTDVQDIQATELAFAAIRRDGSVVTWGHEEYGGDSSHVWKELRNVKMIAATSRAFAAFHEMAKLSAPDPAVPMSSASCLEIWHLHGSVFRERLGKARGDTLGSPCFTEAARGTSDRQWREKRLWKWGGSASHHPGDFLERWFEHSSRWVTASPEGIVPAGRNSFQAHN